MTLSSNKFKNWLANEMYGQYNANNTIVVDIQPYYSQSIKFDIGEFANFLNQMLSKGRKVLYFYNGSDLGISDNDQTIKQWLASSLTGQEQYAYESYGNYENYDDDDYENSDEYRKYEEVLRALNGISFYDKGYGFFRDWMDSGVDESIIIQTIRAMAMYKCNSNDLPDEVLDNLGNGDDLRQHGEIHLPGFDLNYLKSFSNAFICGGGRNECLREIQLLFNAFNIKYTIFSQFVY